MTEQLYRVCWRSYDINNGDVQIARTIQISIYHAYRCLVRFRRDDAIDGVYCDYWLEPV